MAASAGRKRKEERQTRKKRRRKELHKTRVFVTEYPSTVDS
jgi:hypothetical protein